MAFADPHPADDVGEILTEFVRCLQPGGSVLLGLFDGDGSRFDHAVTPAWTWSPPALEAMLSRAGLRITRVEQRPLDGGRAHLAVIATTEPLRP